MQQEIIIITTSIRVVFEFCSVLQPSHDIFILIFSFHNVPHIEFREYEIGESYKHSACFFLHMTIYPRLSLSLLDAQHSHKLPLCLTQISLCFTLCFTLPQFLTTSVHCLLELTSKILDILNFFSHYFLSLCQSLAETWTLLYLRISPTVPVLFLSYHCAQSLQMTVDEDGNLMAWDSKLSRG